VGWIYGEAGDIYLVGMCRWEDEGERGRGRGKEQMKTVSHKSRLSPAALIAPNN